MALSVTQANAVSTKWFDKGKISDQVYDKNAILDRIKKNEQVRVKGGTSIQHTILYRELGQAKMVDPDDARQTVHYDTRTALALDWKYSIVDIIMTWQERVQNRGEPEIIDLMTDKYREGQLDINKLISTQFHQVYTNKGTRDMDGFFTCVQASSSTYAGVDQDDASEWNAGLYDTSTSTLALYGTGSLEAGLRACWFRDYPDLMVTTKALGGIYASKLQTGERRAPETGRAGAVDYYFNKVPVLIDPQCNDNTWMFLDTSEMWFYVQPDYNFLIGDWEEDPDRYHALRALCTVVGNFVFTVRKKFGAYTVITS